MPDQDTKPHHLRLVEDAPQLGPRAPMRQTRPELALSSEPDQLGLFLVASPRMRLFAKAIEVARPRYIFDLRSLPVFEGAGMTRRTMFRVMESIGCTYVDVMGLMEGTQRRDRVLRSGAFEAYVRSVCGHDLVGPMFFLFQSGEDLAWSCSALPRMLQPAPRSGWSVHVLGMDPVQPWRVGDVLYIVASPSESTGWLIDDRGRPAEPVNLRRGSSVRVVDLQIGQWTDVLVLGGPHQGARVRLASNAHVARSV